MTIILLAIATIAMPALGIMTILWMRKIQANIQMIVKNGNHDQIQIAQKMAEALILIQTQQRNDQQQLRILAEANRRLRQELHNVVSNLNNEEEPSTGQRTVH